MLQEFKKGVFKIADKISSGYDSTNSAIKQKVHEMAILNTKKTIAERNKSVDDYTDDEFEMLIKAEEEKIYNTIKSMSIKAVLIFLGLDALL